MSHGRSLLILAASLIGGVAGFGTTLLVCRTVDWMNGATENGGNNLMAVGYIFCVITVPIGCLIGGVLASYATRRWPTKKDNREQKR